MQRKQIPWEYQENSLVRLWTWETPHFILRVTGETKATSIYNWDIKDKSSGTPQIFESGESASFHQAEDEMLEIISKAYPTSLGYGVYAGDLMTTYTIVGGKKINMAPYVDERCTVTYIQKGAADVIVEGVVRLKNYNIIVESNNGVLSIPSTYIREIVSVNARFNFVPDIHKKSSRTIFNEEWRKGCTGRPGFRDGTVEHSAGDESCPIHHT